MHLEAIPSTTASPYFPFGFAFSGLLSLFNIGGRTFWAAMSARWGAERPTIRSSCSALCECANAHTGSKALFVLALGIILSMYGGGFATVPAYLADVFGTRS
jgi:hypothetical protein